MGSSLSSLCKRGLHIKRSRKSYQHDHVNFIPPPSDGPYQDPRSIDDSQTFPLDGQEIASLSESQLLQAHSTAPHLHEYGIVEISRISKSLVIKAGQGVAKSESENMIFASDILHLPVPKMYRAFSGEVPDFYGDGLAKGYFIVMDYIAGPTLEACWNSLDIASRESVAQQVADIIDKLQSKTLNDLPPGPLGRDPDEKFKGPWFTDYGAGPFATLADFEDWFNHKIDACAMVHQLPAGTPRFRFQDVVFTHQDIALRNLILDENKKVWIVDWGCAGVYPRGFDQAVLHAQSGSKEFAKMVLARLLDPQREMTKQYAAIGYGLSTGRLL